MKAIALSDLYKKIKYTITRDGRFGLGKFNYYEDTPDAVVTNPTSHLMVNGSLSLPGLTYDGNGANTNAVNLNNAHHGVIFKGVGSANKAVEVNLPDPSADVLHRIYMISNHKQPAEITKSSGALTSGHSYTVTTLGGSPDFSVNSIGGPSSPVLGSTFVAGASATPTWGTTVVRDNTASSTPIYVTSGTLTINNSYTILIKGTGDFTNVGAASNAAGVTFVATGTTPTSWGSATLRDNTQSGTMLVSYISTGGKTLLATLDPIPYYAKAITKLSDIPTNSITVQCQRLGRTMTSPTYDWKLISASHYPVADTISANVAYTPSSTPPVTVVSTFGGVLALSLYKTTGTSRTTIPVSGTDSVAASFKSAISTTLNTSAGSILTGASNQIVKYWSSGKIVNVSINTAALPAGYTYAGYHLATAGSTTVNQSNFAVTLNGYDTLNPLITATASPLTVGHSYTITTYGSGDSFTNVGAGSNAAGVTFTASGTTPTTWSNGSILRNNTLSAPYNTVQTEVILEFNYTAPTTTTPIKTVTGITLLGE